MNLAIYARVSTEGQKKPDGSRLSGQSVDPQLIELRDWATRNGATVVGEWTDVMSGTKAARPGLDALLARCREGGVEAIIVVKLDRLGRSLLNVIRLVEDLDRIGVAVICTSQGIDTRKGSPCGKMILSIMAAFAEFERALIAERTVSGLVAARARGVILGRPSKRVAADPATIVAEWRATHGGRSLRTLAAMLGGVSVSFASRLAKDNPGEMLEIGE